MQCGKVIPQGVIMLHPRVPTLAGTPSVLCNTVKGR